MSVITDMQRLKDAGFSDPELGDFAVRQRKTLSDAGFSQGEIDTYFGHPPFDPAPVKSYVNDTLKKATAPEGEGATPKPVTSFLEALEYGLQGSTAGLLARGKVPDMTLPADAPRSTKIAANVATLAGDIPAMAGGYLFGGANPITGTAGAFALPAGVRRILMDKYEKGEVASFSDFWDRFSGAFIDTAKGWITGAATGAVGKAVGMAPIASPTLKNAATVTSEIGTMVTVGSALEGQVPNPEDFLDAALTLGFVKGSVAMAGKLRRLYAETGVRPADVVKDAEKDPTIAQDLASDNVDIPKAYQVPAIAGKPPGQQPPGQPPEQSSAQPPSGALSEVGKRIRVGGEPDKPYTWQDLYTDVFDDFNPIREAVKQAIADLPEGTKTPSTAKDPYTLARLTRGTFGKADHFLEQGTFDFRTYQTTGQSMKAIVAPVKSDLQKLREYLVAKRDIELSGRGIETGADLPVSRAAVEEGKAKFDAVAKNLVEYQNSTVKYLRDAGLLSDEAYQAMLEANKNYVPFFRVMDPEAPRGPGRGFSVEQPIKGIKGSERQIIDPLESIIKNTYTYIAIAERNQVGRAYIELANKTGNPADYYKKIPTPVKPIHLTEEEIRNVFDEFLTVKKKVSKTREETSTATGTSGEPDTKAFTMVKNRVLEALAARGFSKGEADQMVARLMAKEATGATVEKLVKEIEKTEYMPELDIRLPNEAATIFRAMRTPLKPNEIAVWEKGKRTVYEVDPDVAAAMKAADVETANMLLKMISIPAKTLRAGAILSPDFIARNALRDQLSATILSRGGYVPIFDFVRGALSLAKQDEAYGNWLKGGGANAAMVSVDRHYIQENIFKLSQDTGLMAKSWNVVKSPIEFLRIASELTENATRLGEFKRVVGDRTGKQAIQEAAFASREVTLDFARIGAKSRAMNMISAFFNAQIQGVDRLGRAIAENPVGTLTKIGAAVTLPSIMLWWANHDDPRYKDIPQWQKDLFWIVMTKDTIYRIPKPFELGLVFGTLPERSLDAFFADNPKAFKNFENALIDAFLPNIVPNVAQPIVEQFSNRSLLTGNPIVPAHVEPLLPEYQYTEYTTETAKALGKLIGAFPGLRDRSIQDPGALGGVARALSTPVLVENYVRAWTGGLGMYALTLADKGLRDAGVVPDPVLPAKTLADLPVIKAFVVRYPSASVQSIQDFYDGYYAAKRYHDTAMNIAKDPFGKDTGKIVPFEEQGLGASLSGMRETMTEMSQVIRMIHKNPDMTPDDKRQLIDTLYFRMIDIAHAGNDMLSTLNAGAKK